MTAFYKIVDGDYIAGIGTNGNDSVTEISKVEYDNMLSLIRSMPSAHDGYTYKLRADSLEWELVKLPLEETEATAPDYEAALREVGVDV